MSKPGRKKVRLWDDSIEGEEEVASPITRNLCWC